MRHLDTVLSGYCNNSFYRLILRENNIDTLPTKAFINFDAINFTSLQGNPMRNIDAEAFRDAKIKVYNCSQLINRSKWVRIVFFLNTFVNN